MPVPGCEFVDAVEAENDEAEPEAGSDKKSDAEGKQGAGCGMWGVGRGFFVESEPEREENLGNEDEGEIFGDQR